METASNVSSRDILLFQEINETSALDVVNKILEINRVDDQKEKELKDYKREPIKLYISTYGGSVYDGLAVVDAISNSKTEVHTIATGKVMSMGLPILLSGHKRYGDKYGTIMYHEVTNYVWDKATEIRRTLDETNRLQGVVDEIILSKTAILKDKLDEVKEKKIDWYISMQEALRLNIVEEIIK